MHKIYVAAPFTEWPTAASLRAWLRARHIDCTASWIDEAAATHGSEGLADLSTDECDAIAQRNDADVLESHAVIALLFTDKGTEQFEECGFARAKGIPVVYVDHGRKPHLSTRRMCNGYASTWLEALETVLMLGRQSRTHAAE
jgi:nucleoside 2-deoxyribosyltransferase